MDNKLPKVFANRVTNSSNKKFFYSELEKNNSDNSFRRNPNLNTKDEILKKYNLKDTIKKSDVRNKIIDLFKSPNNVYKVNAKLRVGGKTITKSLIGRTNSTLITLDDEIIRIDDIEDIEAI